jgi:hypothetical protein
MSAPDWYNQVKAVFDKYGVPSSVWYPIALAESGGDPNAVGDKGASIGIFQINRVGGQGIGYSADQLRDPTTNAEVAAKAIVPAYHAVAGTVSNDALASEVARRSGHPGGSISNPFNANDSRIQRIKTLASEFVGGFDAASNVGVTGQTGSGGNLWTDASQAATGTINAALGSVLSPFKPIADATNELKKVFETMGAPGFLLGTLGVVIILISLAALFAESNAGKATIKAAGDTAKLGILAA